MTQRTLTRTLARLVLPAALLGSGTATASQDDQVLLSVERQDKSVQVAPDYDLDTHAERGRFERIEVPREQAEAYRKLIRQHDNVLRVGIDPGASVPQPTQPTMGSQSYLGAPWDGREAYSDTGFEYQQHFAEVTGDTPGASGILQAHEASVVNERLSVVVIDSQFEQHPDFTWQGGYDFVDDTNDGWYEAYDPGSCTSYHGQQVASVMGAHRDSGRSVAGIAEADYYAARALGCDGSGSFADILDAIEWAVGETPGDAQQIEQNADIINLSLGGATTCSEFPGLQSAVDKANDRGAIVVASSGNDDSDVGEGYAPADCEGVVTVAANDRAGERSDFSNTGDAVDFTALGTAMPVQTPTEHGSEYSFVSGTSFSSPAVAAMLTLAWKQVPELEASEIVQLAYEATTDTQGDEQYGMGAGILNARQLMEAMAAFEESVEVAHPLASDCPNRSVAAEAAAGDQRFCDAREIRLDPERDNPELYRVITDGDGQVVAASTRTHFPVPQAEPDGEYEVSICEDPEAQECVAEEVITLDMSAIGAHPVEGCDT